VNIILSSKVREFERTFECWYIRSGRSIYILDILRINKLSYKGKKTSIYAQRRLFEAASGELTRTVFGKRIQEKN